MKVYNLATGKVYHVSGRDALYVLHKASKQYGNVSKPSFWYGQASIAYGALAVKVDTRGYLWNKACAFDKIPASSMFVVFSSKNPYAKALDKISR